MERGKLYGGEESVHIRFGFGAQIHRWWRLRLSHTMSHLSMRSVRVCMRDVRTMFVLGPSFVCLFVNSHNGKICWLLLPALRKPVIFYYYLNALFSCSCELCLKLSELSGRVCVCMRPVCGIRMCVLFFSWLFDCDLLISMGITDADDVALLMMTMMCD